MKDTTIVRGQMINMRALFTVNAVIQFLFGAGFLLVPALVLGIFGAQTDATGLTLARVAGGAIISLGLISWLGKDIELPAAQDAIGWGFTLAHFVAGVLCVISILAGTFNALTWSSVVMDALLVAAFVWVRQNRGK
jgi:hypothetical protein